MTSSFNIQYGEFSVANELKNRLKDLSIFVPTSSTEKGIDLLLYRFDYEKSKTRTLSVQVKQSRAYEESDGFGLWFNSFVPSENADWFIFLGTYVVPGKKITWKKVYLAFNRKQMAAFFEKYVKTKKGDPDRFFGFKVCSDGKIFLTRGCSKGDSMNEYLLENQISKIAKDIGSELARKAKRQKK